MKPFLTFFLLMFSALSIAKDFGVRMHLEVSTHTPFVEQNIVYTQTVSIPMQFAREMQDYKLRPPSVQDVTFQRPGSSESKTEIIDGKKYWTITDHILATPQSSGVLVIPSPTFKGKIRSRKHYEKRSGNMTFVEDIVTPQPFSIQGNEVTLQVKPEPKHEGHDWLPAYRLSLQEEWNDQGKTWRVGQPVERIVTLAAEGLLKSQLPQLSFMNQKGLKVYPTEVEHVESVDNKKILSGTQWKITYIPTEAGQTKLPPVRCDWWDLKAHKAKTAWLPSREKLIRMASPSKD